MHQLAAVLCAALTIAPPTAGAQLHYDRTTFIHGFNDGPERWRHKNSPGILGQQVNLGPNFSDPNDVVNLDGSLSITDQADRLRNNWLNPTGGSHVLLGLSMGGVVARKAYLKSNGANIAGIVTIGSPHQGAIIADNATKITGFGVRLVSDFFGTVADILLRPTPSTILGAVIGVLIKALVNQVITGVIRPYVEQAFGLNSPAINDLKTTSPTIASLKTTYDNAPHADVYSTLGKRDAVYRLAFSALYKDGYADALITTKNVVRNATKLCAHIGYNWIVKTSTGKMCHKATVSIGSIDDRWVQWTLNGHKEWPFDGLLPNSAQQYPGNTKHFPTTGANHMNLQYDSRATNQIVNAMFAIQMQHAGSPVP